MQAVIASKVPKNPKIKEYQGKADASLWKNLK